MALTAHGPDTAVTRLVIRLIRRGVLLLALGIALYAAVEAFSYLATYPDAESRARLARFEDSPAVRMLQGYPHAVDTTGGFVVWDGGWFLQSIVAIWGLLVTGRLLRGEEDAERAEFVLTAPVSSRRVLGLQLLVIAAALLTVSAIMAAVLIAAGCSVGGSLIFALGVAGFAGTFAGIAAVCAQIFDMRRRTTTITAALFGAAFLVRMAANSADSRTWMHWLTPFGWMDELHAYRDPNWIALALVVISPLSLAAVALRLRLLRDTGGALRAEPDRRKPRTRFLGGPTAFAWRTTRGTLFGWTAGIAAYALVVGSLVEAVADFVADDPSYRDVLETLGWDLDQLTQAFVGYMGSFLAFFMALFACWRVGAARTEESTGRLDNILTRPVARLRWLGGHAALTLAGAAFIAVASALALWLGAWTASATISLADVFSALFAGFPLIILFTGLAVLVYAVAPHLAIGVPVGVTIIAYLLQMIGPALKWPDWILGISPFHHLPPVPAEPFAPLSATVMGALGIVLMLAGLALFNRRDLTGE